MNRTRRKSKKNFRYLHKTTMNLVTISTILVVAITCLSSDGVTAQESVSYYNEIEIAPYEVVARYNKDTPRYAYEERVYPAAWWVTTKSSSGFNKLFAYIMGMNANGTKIAMTAPVLNTISQTVSGYSSKMAFYIPEKYQENRPEPTGDEVTLEKLPSMTVYVRTYGGWSNIKAIQFELRRLVASLNRDEKKFLKDDVYTAGYDGPMHFGKRRNEIWLLKNPQ